jgi:hypothetical protein
MMVGPLHASYGNGMVRRLQRQSRTAAGSPSWKLWKPSRLEFASQTNRSLPLKSLLANPAAGGFCTTKTQSGHLRQRS